MSICGASHTSSGHMAASRERFMATMPISNARSCSMLVWSRFTTLLVAIHKCRPLRARTHAVSHVTFVPHTHTNSVLLKHVCAVTVLVPRASRGTLVSPHDRNIEHVFAFEMKYAFRRSTQSQSAILLPTAGSLDTAGALSNPTAVHPATTHIQA